MKKNNNIVIKHSIPGRIRLRIKGLQSLNSFPKSLDELLSQIEFVQNVEIRPLTGSIIIFYQPEKGTFDQIVQILLERMDFLNTTYKNVYDEKKGGKACKTTQPCSCCSVQTRKTSSLARQALGLIFITGYVLYAFIKEKLFKSPVSENALSLTSAVAAIGAWPLLKQAWNDFRHGRRFSLFPFLAATFVLAISLGQAMTALEVIWILRLGMLLEDYVSEKSRKAISDILKLAEKNTYILIDGVEVEVEPDSLKRGNIVVCHTGEKIPVDGTVIKGEALVDQAAITGRAEVEEKRKGNRVFAGTLVSQGIIYIKAEKVGDSTYLARIIQMVEGSLSKRAPSEKMADMLANRLTIMGAVAVAGTFILTLSPMRAFTVLLVLACPCATVLAASTAVSAAIASAAKNLILIKGGFYLEKVGQIECFCFDKTGTLTSEYLALIQIITRTYNQNPDSILAIAAAAEAHNQHPVAKAILAAAKEKDLKLPAHQVCEFIIGRGVRAVIGGDEILVGNMEMMKEAGADTSWFRNKIRAEIKQGHTAVFVARNRKVQGVLIIANPLRPETPIVSKTLREDGVKQIHLISGDTTEIVKQIGEKFGFDAVQGDLFPEQKARYISKLESQGIETAMIGDGINDAVALAEASIGIAMGAGGAEAAIEAADIALVDSNLEGLIHIRQLSRKTVGVIEQNHILAMTTNIGGVIMGAAGLLSPVMAGALHIIHTLGILLNSGRLLGWKPVPLLPNKDIHPIEKDGGDFEKGN